MVRSVYEFLKTYGSKPDLSPLPTLTEEEAENVIATFKKAYPDLFQESEEV